MMHQSIKLPTIRGVNQISQQVLKVRNEKERDIFFSRFYFFVENDRYNCCTLGFDEKKTRQREAVHSPMP
jgi:hypothetical protein